MVRPLCLRLCPQALIPTPTPPCKPPFKHPGLPLTVHHTAASAPPHWPALAVRARYSLLDESNPLAGLRVNNFARRGSVTGPATGIDM